MKKILLSGFLTSMVVLLFAQVQVGRTTYDLQTNSAVGRRIVTDASGEILVTYTRSHEMSDAYTDRGTGLNRSANNGTTWDETTFTGAFTRPDSARTGWPTPLLTTGKEVIVSHFSGGSANGLQVMRRDKGTNNAWEKIVLDSEPSSTWARAASSGDSIFVIAGRYQNDMPGMTGGLEMYRSTDGGATWTGPDAIPLVNSINFTSVGGDNYSIDMNNGKVAIVLGSYQVELLTSTDFGATFTKKTVLRTYDLNGNPVPLFSGGAGESLRKMDGSDRSYSLVIDDNGLTHVWFGKLSSLEKTNVGAADGATYLTLDRQRSSSIMYWNENMTGDAITIHKSRIANVQAGLGWSYFSRRVLGSNASQQKQQDIIRNPYVSMPNGAYDASGNIYVVYSSIVPLTFDNLADLSTYNNIRPRSFTDGFHFQAIYVLKSSDNGVTWEGPLNVSNAPEKDCLYPSIPRKITGSDIPVIWQQDTVPGMKIALRENDPLYIPITENEIMFKNVPIASIVTPADITMPTLFLVEPNDSAVTGFQNCDIDFSSKVINDDVPTGPNVLAINTVDPLPTTAGVHDIQIYTIDAAGNKSDTVNIKLTLDSDNTAPVITLVGPDTVDLLLNATYTDPGITYTDNACDPTTAPASTNTIDNTTVGTYYYKWTVTDNSGNAADKTRYVRVIAADVTAPVITLNGNAVDSVEVCGSYTDMGATSFDNIDYNITSGIVVTGTVDAMTIGTYTITYTSTDAANNTATETRTVYVVDRTAPEVTVNFTESKFRVCKGNAFTAPTATAADCADSSPTLVNDGATVVDVNTAGNYTVTYTATDASGNEGTATLLVEVGEAPVPNFTIDYTVGSSRVAVEDISTGGIPTERTWDWGDGSITHSLSSTHHPYRSKGTKTITLTVNNAFVTACNTPAANLTISKTVDVDFEVSIEDVQLDASVAVYPNPSEGVVNVNLSEVKEEATITIYNVLGEKIDTRKVEDNSTLQEFSFGENAAGVYFINIATEKASIAKRVVVK